MPFFCFFLFFFKKSIVTKNQHILYLLCIIRVHSLNIFRIYNFMLGNFETQFIFSEIFTIKNIIKVLGRNKLIKYEKINIIN